MKPLGAASNERENMRSITKATLRTSIAGLAVAGAVLGGAGMASAAPVTPAHAPSCNPFQKEQWNLNGNNTVVAVFEGNNYPYSVHFKQYGSCLRGSLTDPGVQPSGLTGPVSGTIYKNYVTFSFDYGTTSVQGVRTYSGIINKWGSVSGFWTQTGSQGPNQFDPTTTWSLTNKAKHACSYYWRHPNRSCYVFP
jgi:hypothetical protein